MPQRTMRRHSQTVCLVVLCLWPHTSHGWRSVLPVGRTSTRSSRRDGSLGPSVTFAPRRTRLLESTDRSDRSSDSTTSLDEAIAAFARRNFEATGNSTSNRVSAIQTRLVQLGLEYQQQQRSTIHIHNDTLSTSTQVPGCLATVHVQSILAPGDDTVLDEVRGTADAHLSRGLLACVAATFRQQPVAHVLSYDATTLRDALGLTLVLSVGRTNGLVSLVHTLQTQLRHRLDTEVDKGNLSTSSAPKDVNATGDTTLSAPTTTTTVPTYYTPPRVALLLSGGVDSSVALHLLVRERHTIYDANNTPIRTVPKYNVTAFYLKIWLADELSHLGTCPWHDDWDQCVAVCQPLHVPLEALSLHDDYQRLVLAHTTTQVARGRTPNPDVLCNARIKFGCFYTAVVTERSFDWMATGHYAQVVRDCERGDDDDTLHGSSTPAVDGVRLHRAPDPVKDQSYFLCALTQQQLSRVLFPIGHYEKSQVRALADKWQLPNRHRPDSQGLCFLGRIKFNDFLASILPDDPGPVVDAATGHVVGTHRGLWYHTIGQRKGLGPVLHPTVTSQGPWFVVAKDPATKSIYCSNRYHDPMYTVPRSEFAVEEIHWIASHRPSSVRVDAPCGLTMKIRHGPKLVRGTLTLDNATTGQVRLEEKDSGLAPGQYVAFYNDTECLGSAIISEQHWTRFLERGLRSSRTDHPAHANMSHPMTTR